MKTARILVSSIELPTTNVGSWTTRMNRFLECNTDFFDYVLSPNNSQPYSLYCKKRKFLTWKKSVRNIQLLNWVAKDYVKEIKKLAKNYDKISLLVMDDPHLLEAISFIKNKLKSDIELIFSFHGFELNIDPKILSKIDKILFLSNMGCEKSKLNYDSFPKSYIVGNAVDSNIFYPLKPSEFKTKRKKLGYDDKDEILIWMSNDRPQKGFHVFEKIVTELLKTNKDLKVLIIGSRKTVSHKNVKSIGKIKNEDVANYLQIGDYYMFTTLYQEGFGLSVIEALKCGNIVISSSRGAIPEVLNGLQNSYLINDVENIKEWIDTFNLARINNDQIQDKLSKVITDDIWNYVDWERKFINAVE